MMQTPTAQTRAAPTVQTKEFHSGDPDLFLREVALQEADFLFQVFQIFFVVINFFLLLSLISVPLLL